MVCLYGEHVLIEMHLWAQSVEVLWTPQDEDDTLNERELLRDYPLLLSL